MNPNDLDQLLVRYLDGNLTTDEVETLNRCLKEDAEGRALLREMASQAVMLNDLARKQEPSTTRRQAEHSGTPVRAWRVRLIAVAATIFLLLGVGAYWIWRESGVEVAITQASGAVSWTSEDGQRHGLETGDTFRGGTLSLEGAASSAELLLGDGSVLTLTGDSELMVPDRSGMRFLLRRGALSADVRPRAADCPMVIRTPVAEIEVLGTRFQVAAQPAETAVAVDTGRVRMMRLADEASVNVSEKQTASVSLDAAEPMGVGALAPAPQRWSQMFEQAPQDIWSGEWVRADADGPDRLRNVPDFSYRRPNGTPVAAYTVNARDDLGTIASVSPESVLRLRYRIQPPHGMLVLVGLHSSTGCFAGNYQTFFKPTADDQADGGWRDFEAPLSTLERAAGPSPDIPHGGRVFLVYLACYSPEAQLEVAEIAIEPGPSRSVTTANNQP